MRRPTLIRSLLWSGLALLPLVSAVGCARSSASPEPAARPISANPATVHPQRRTLTKVLEQPGRIEGYEATTLMARVPGYLKEWCVDKGDHVFEGQLLAILESPDLLREVEQKAALVKQAEAEVVQALRVKDATEATVNRAKANIRLAEASLGRTEASVIRRGADLDRAERLYRTNSIEREKLDQARDDNEAAKAALAENEASIAAMKAALKEAEAQRDKAVADVAVARAKEDVARADYEHSRANASYLDLYAPYDGIITEKYGSVGDLMQPSSGRATLYTMNRIDQVRVWIDVPESDAVFITRGQAAWVRVPSLDDQEVEGRVERDTHALDAQSRTLRIQITLPNPNERLRPGFYVTGRLIVSHPDVWTVPATAVWVQDDQPMVVRIENGVARRTPVRLGTSQGGYTQVLRKQVRVVPRGEPLPWDDWTGSEEIVVDNPSAVPDGQPFGQR